MAASPQVAIQKAVYDLLVADATLIGSTLLNAASVFDFVPEATAFPYVSLGEDSFIDWGTHTTDGMEGTLQVDSWSREAGRKQCKDIMDRIYTLLHDFALVVTGFTVTLLRLESTSIERDPDGLTYHGISRFKILVGT